MEQQSGFCRDLREEFLEETTSTQASYQNFLTCINTLLIPMEDKFGIPLESVAPSDIEAYLSDSTIGNTATMRRVISAINTYRAWTAHKYRGVFRLNASQKVSIFRVDMSQSIRNAYYCFPDELLRATNKYPVDDGYLDTVFGILYWMGFSTKEIISLTEDDIVIYGNTMTIAGKPVRYPEFVEELRKYLSSNTVVRSDGRIYVKADGKELLRRFGISDGKRVQTPLTERFITNYLRDKACSYEKTFTPTGLIRTGRMDRLWQLSCIKPLSRMDIEQEFGVTARVGVHDLTMDVEAYCKIRNEG